MPDSRSSGKEIAAIVISLVALVGSGMGFLLNMQKDFTLAESSSRPSTIIGLYQTCLSYSQLVLQMDESGVSPKRIDALTDRLSEPVVGQPDSDDESLRNLCGSASELVKARGTSRK